MLSLHNTKYVQGLILNKLFVNSRSKYCWDFVPISHTWSWSWSYYWSEKKNFNAKFALKQSN